MREFTCETFKKIYLFFFELMPLANLVIENL